MTDINNLSSEFISKIYRCKIVHHRFLPKVHHFKYGIFMLYLYLDELDSLSEVIPLLSRNRFNLFSFYDNDHLKFSQENDLALKERMVRYLFEQGVIASVSHFSGRIALLTLPRILGYVFNPVSFYFVFDKDGTPLASVAEVGNTFGEMKIYLLTDKKSNTDATTFDLVTAKHFYVSPFSSVADFFHFNLPLPGESLNLSIKSLSPSGEALLTTNLSGQSRSITELNLTLFLQYPLLTLKVIGSIHFHALLLWLKKIPFYAKQDNAELQTDVLGQPKEQNVKVEA